MLPFPIEKWQHFDVSFLQLKVLWESLKPQLNFTLSICCFATVGSIQCTSPFCVDLFIISLTQNGTDELFLNCSIGF